MDKLTACCGLDCEKCDARTATLTNDDGLRERTAALWSKLNGVTITPEMINCTGCRTLGRIAENDPSVLENLKRLRRAGQTGAEAAETAAGMTLLGIL